MFNDAITNLHHLFTGTAKLEIKTKNSLNTHYFVDLANNRCSCQWGASSKWSKDKEVLNQYCSHKLSLMRSITEKNYELCLPAFLKALSTRYNSFELVSAFHKELRRGSFDSAMYWLSLFLNYRDKRYVLKYMLSIVYEETRDHDLAFMMIRKYEKSIITFSDLEQSVQRFCIAKKKWELPHRMDIFLSEMDGYSKLAKKYTYDVAKSGEVIPANALSMLRQSMLNGFKSGNRNLVQFGMKGMYKTKPPTGMDHKDLKLWVFDLLQDVYCDKYDNKFDIDDNDVSILRDLVIAKYNAVGEVRYHDLNMFCDALCGESYSAGLLPQKTDNESSEIANICNYAFPINESRAIPLYAQDNHTWGGNALMKKYHYELHYEYPQENIDFRWCGAYFGVAWRHLAYQQHGSCDVAWNSLEWNDKFYNHVLNMFY